ncbi:MAG: tRNA uridine-5-carboxymethylaminomethyl(34) synthesis enzyme MnmG [candidate division Zixibacteria bacterium]|nr:tRNA uridine-5-carboxymethylaminomethyl(34) synthesis enzyme MnmG [candidate division Zixibacteria bacterium]
MNFDVIVVGGGHAGVEAAYTVSRMGKKVAIISMDISKLALMSCNPSIGGTGKSHVVKEIDVLGGIMGEATDATGIQFRKLNLSRGPAVWSTRVQVDRVNYNSHIVDIIKKQPNIELIEGLAGEILVENGKIAGIKMETGEILLSKTAIIASGTFLGGLIHIGKKKIKAGRLGENAAYKLSESLSSLGFEVGRLKTGTPPRLDGNSIDWDKCEIQNGDSPIPFFSLRSNRKKFEQIPCHLTYTTVETKRIISDNFKLSAMFSGQINSTGPRYCPSIEDKYFRFADKDVHQLFLEPEGNGTSEIYPNGFSTSLPENIQKQAINSVTGLEKAIITQPGYAIEYDYCPTYQIKPSLETKKIPGLFFAGQINGTSGYEEAAGQGLMAGVNSVLYIEKEPPFILDRAEAYIGVMIDDLTTRSTTEPYRLFTSRAEYRLTLREDNAQDRLIKYGEKYSLINKAEIKKYTAINKGTVDTIKKISTVRVKVSDLGEVGKRYQKIDNVSLENLVKQPGVSVDDAIKYIKQYISDIDVDDFILSRVAIQVKYSGYVDRQQREIEKFKKMESESIPQGFDFSSLVGLKTEALEKFIRYKPVSLGQAGRIEGVTPGDLSVLSVQLLRYKALNDVQ